jgi:two-component system OmpR family sensor kinase
LRILIDIGTLIFIFGLLLSILIGITLYLFHYLQLLQNEFAKLAADDRRRFLQRLDHELKNPLTAILAGLANLQSLTADEPYRSSLASVDAQVKRLRDLVADLRKLSDLETREFEQVPVDVGKLLEALVGLTREEEAVQARRLSLALPQAPWPLPIVKGDWDLLYLAVHNLLQNALKFTSPGDTIEIRAYEDGSEVAIEVADTGPGIQEEEVPQVWDELYRGEGARGIPGSGLGLTLVRAIISRHGGRVALRSRVGQGTVVAIRLPVAEMPRRQ